MPPNDSLKLTHTALFSCPSLISVWAVGVALSLALQTSKLSTRYILMLLKSSARLSMAGLHKKP